VDWGEPEGREESRAKQEVKRTRVKFIVRSMERSIGRSKEELRAQRMDRWSRKKRSRQKKEI
jgi:hypothetical protein